MIPTLLALVLAGGATAADPFAASPVLEAPPGWSPYVERVTSPRLIHKERPEFPGRATRAGLRDATVVVIARIAPTGDVEPIRALECSAPGYGFEKEALRTVATWRFTPGFADGKPVGVSLAVTVRFHREVTALPA